MARYCLANYILTVNVPEEINLGVSSINIGGEGSYLDSITVKVNGGWKISGDSTGSWVHTKDLDRTGTIEVSINQMSNKISIFKSLMTIYRNLDTEVEGLTLTLTDNLGNLICIAQDCILADYPDQSFSNEPSTQSWTFNCGKVVLN